MNTALILIDVQASFRRRPSWVEARATQFLARTDALIEGCIARGVPVVRILHSDGPDDPSNPFSIASGFVRPQADLTAYDAAAEFVKHRHSALVGTGLAV